MSTQQTEQAVGMENAATYHRQPTVKDLVDFVLANKKDKCFIGYDSDSRVANEVIYNLNRGTLYYEASPTGKILGMIMADFYPDKKLAFVTENLSMSLSRLKRFALKLYNEHPDWNVQAIRHNHPVSLNLKQLINKL